MTLLKLKRAYDPQTPDDGYRVYVDRLWPRGLSHDTFHYDAWEKAIAPSTALREWFHADTQTRWEAFVEKYKAELKANPSFADMAEGLKSHAVVTLLYSSRDTEHDNAHVVESCLTEQYPGDFKA